jgi:hypothetical protein
MILFSLSLRSSSNSFGETKLLDSRISQEMNFKRVIM